MEDGRLSSWVFLVGVRGIGPITLNIAGHFPVSLFCWGGMSHEILIINSQNKKMASSWNVSDMIIDNV